MPLGTAALNNHRLCVCVVVFRARLVVSDTYQLFQVERREIGTRQDFHLLVERYRQRGESIVRIADTNSKRVNVTRTYGNAIQVGVSKGAIPTQRSIIEARLRRTGQHLNAQVNISDGVYASGKVRGLYVERALRVQRLQNTYRGK